LLANKAREASQRSAASRVSGRKELARISGTSRRPETGKRHEPPARGGSGWQIYP
jgi:hypothetical protein